MERPKEGIVYYMHMLIPKVEKVNVLDTCCIGNKV